MPSTRSWRARLSALTGVLAVLAVLAATLLGGSLPASAANIAPFTPVFSTNAHGTVLMAANTLMTCSTTSGTGSGTCATARASNDVSLTSTVRNNNFTGAFVDVLADGATTFNSSSARLTVPDDSSVLFAALVWGGRTSTSNATSSNAAKRQTAYLKVDSDAGEDVAGRAITSTWFAETSATQGYQAYLDVTDVVTAAGSGSYTVGNVQSTTGTDNTFAGWSLVVAVSDATLPMRNLSVFRGFSEIQNAVGSREVAFDVSGFLTPPSGAVRTTLGAVTYEGDRGSTGDRFTLNSTDLSDGLNPTTDVFNSTISDRGTRVSAGQNPDYANQLGFDADLFAADGILPNGATSATLKATTSSEQYWIGLVTFATDLYEPNVHGNKSVTLVDRDASATTTVGDELTYSVIVENTGLDVASGTVLYDAIPTGTTYVPGSLSITRDPVMDGDEASGTYVPDTTWATGGAIRAALGDVPVSTGTTPRYVVEFTVTIDSAVRAGQELLNIAQVTSRGATTRTVTGAVTNTTLNVVPVGGATGVPTVRDHTAVLVPTPTVASATVDLLAGASETGLTVVGSTMPARGTLVDGGDGTVSYTPEPDFAGRDAFTYTVRDADGNAATGTVVIEVVNTAPTAVDDPVDLDVDVPAATATPVAVLGNDTDANGDALRVRSITVGTTTVTSGPLTTAAGGTVTLTDGAVTYTKPAGGLAVGATDTFDYVVEDTRGGSDAGTVTVTGRQINSAPTAGDDEADALVGGAAVTIPVLADDVDPDAGDALTVTVESGPARGSVTVVGNQLRYTPPATGAGGEVTFTYRVTDGAGAFDVATVTVTLDAAPVAADDTATTPSATAVVVDVLDDDTDPDGDDLRVTSVGTPSHGAASVVTVDGRTQVRYTPATGFVGDATVTYTVSDDRGGSDTATLTVTVANAAPVANADTRGTTVGATLTGVDVLANDTDANLTAGFGAQELSVTGATATHGTVTVASDGTLTVVPDAGYVGDVVVTYTISDGAGGTATGTLTVTVTNTDPVAVPDTATTGTSQAVTVDVLDNDTDGDEETLTIVAGSLTAPRDQDDVVRGEVAVVDGRVVYTPPTGWTGTVTFDYAATDGHTQDAATVTVTVTNAAPTADGTAAGTATGTAVTVDVLTSASDENSAYQTLTVVGATADHGAQVVVNPDGTLTVTPAPGFAGDVTVSYTVSDGTDTVTATLVVTVANAAPAPVDDEVVTAPGVTARIPLLTNDTDENGDPLTVTGVSAPRDASGAVRGTVTVDADGVATYVPAAGFTGVVTFTYTVSDGSTTSTATVTVAIGAQVTPTDGRVTTPNDTAVVVDVTGPDETVVGVEEPEHGTVEVVDGTLVYTPDPGFVGEVVLEYEVEDGDGNRETRTVTIVVTDPSDTTPTPTPTPTPDPTTDPTPTPDPTTDPTPDPTGDPTQEPTAEASPTPETGDGDDLAVTGSEAGALAGLAVLLVVAGAALALAVRRRA
ncbi:tandem-95 repeat protein [Cellulomonas sp. DKR-3]|uniref:Tandem-95 repeat protein n=1 Tax=Cellulomonas fulva TaxID=2835530 RepID=A0ABS5TVX8_9CELL|nr:Ig-like domain-containing protein [Cellulomonas fulva]MBT0993303.1 tandem-95 repeat protein [Cellulomonas fulva]